jgi:hypothetical protein
MKFGKPKFNLQIKEEEILKNIKYKNIVIKRRCIIQSNIVTPLSTIWELL